jgi:hypothetical protein
MAETRHQLLHARAGRGRESPANVTQVVEMQTRQSGLPAWGIPGQRKFERRSGAPIGPTKTRPRSPGWPNRSRCQGSSGTRSSGKLTIRRPARDLGLSGRISPLSNGADETHKCDPWHVGKRLSFIEAATNRLRFLVDEQGFLGPETEKDNFVPGISTVRYHHRNDMTIEVVHVVGPMDEAYVETRWRRETDNEQGDLIHIGRNTTHTGYQLRRVLNLQAEAICSLLGMT